MCDEVAYGDVTLVDEQFLSRMVGLMLYASATIASLRNII